MAVSQLAAGLDAFAPNPRMGAHRHEEREEVRTFIFQRCFAGTLGGAGGGRNVPKGEGDDPAIAGREFWAEGRYARDGVLRREVSMSGISGISDGYGSLGRGEEKKMRAEFVGIFKTKTQLVSIGINLGWFET